MDEKKKFYEKGWFAILMLFLFAPVGIFLLWKHHRKHKILNVIATIVFGVPFLFIVIAIFSPSESFEERSRIDQEQRDIAAANSVQSEVESQEQYSDNDKISPDKSISLVQTYTNEDEGFSFEYPSDWTILEGTELYDISFDDSAIVMVHSPGEIGQVSNILVNKTNVDNALFDFTKDDFQDILSDTFSSAYHGAVVDVFESGELNIHGVPAIGLAMTIDIEDRTLMVKRYYYINNNHTYIITSTTNEKDFEIHTPVLDDISESYRITQLSGEIGTKNLTADDARILLESSLISNQIEDVYLDTPVDNGDNYLFNIDVFIGDSHSSLWIFVNKITGEMLYSPTTAFFDDPTVELYPLDDWYNMYSTSLNANPEDEYDDEYYEGNNADIGGGFVTYINDGFILAMPSNAKISSQVEKEAVNQFSISGGAEVPTEKIYKVEFIWGVADVNVQVNIFPNNGEFLDATNISVPNADEAYLYQNISDSILETSKYELKVIRNDLVYILETTYNPYVALTGQAKGQDDFSYERELLKELLSTFETMINSFALTDNAVSFETIANSDTYWQEEVTNLIR